MLLCPLFSCRTFPTSAKSGSLKLRLVSLLNFCNVHMVKASDMKHREKVLTPPKKSNR